MYELKQMATKSRPDMIDPRWLPGKKCADMMKPMKTMNIMGIMKKL
jgi:hypothetical protein